jgi:hypothetical protein
MRAKRRFTLTPPARVATISETGTGLSEAAYFGLAMAGCDHKYTSRAAGSRAAAGLRRA